MIHTLYIYSAVVIKNTFKPTGYNVLYLYKSFKEW